jgi:LysM repeat protein
MATPDLTAPTPVRLSATARRFSIRFRTCIPAFLVFSCAVIGVAQCHAQDVAEAAKQERARKQAQQKKSKHVYTEEDLKRAQILTPEDRAQLEAQKNQPTPPTADNSRQATDAAVQPPVDVSSLDGEPIGFPVIPNPGAQPLPPAAPLGDVARRFRQLKLSQALQRSAEFHLPFAEAPVLASPRPPLQPLSAPLPTIEPAPPSPDFNAAPPSPIFKTNSPRLATPPPSLQPSHPSLPVLNPSHPRFAPSQPLVKRSPFARPPASVLASPRLTPSRPPAIRVAPASPAAPIAKPRAKAPIAPAASAKRNVITVQPGDSLWKLATQTLGQGLRWRDLLAVNPGILNPNHIVAGTQLYLPASLPTATKFTVRPGDTLSQIAQSQLGHASYAACIAQANPAIRDANRIYPGQSLLLPANCKP